MVYIYSVQMLPGISIRLDADSDVPAVRQIADGLRVLLVDGRLLAGSSLPPVRRLAMELQVHFNTVAEAYRQLAAEGWLDLQHGRGARVVERTAPEVRANWLAEFQKRLRGLVAQIRAEGAPVDEIAAELRFMAKEMTKR